MRICDACHLESPVGKLSLHWNPSGDQRGAEVRDGELCKTCAELVAARDWLALADRIRDIRGPRPVAKPLPADRPIKDHAFSGDNLTGTTCSCGRPREEHAILPRGGPFGSDPAVAGSERIPGVKRTRNAGFDE